VTTAVVVQARVGSKRFPAKVLKPLAGHTVLDEVLRRCRAVKGADVVVCAIPDGAEDDILVPIAARHATVVRGSASDVLSRYVVAAKTVGADVVMRVTSDCPLIDPAVCAEVLALRDAEGADYASNNMPPSFPHGLDCEAFKAQWLYRADDEARLPEEREHVTPWLRADERLKRINLSDAKGDAVDQRWTLDYPLDHAFLTAVFARLPASGIPPWREVLGIIESYPEIEAINRQHRAPRRA
jgi:glutamate-1-semialdehyde 2,1-aminomutase/spore coat polysaccharide biosynthesis protein SpsF